MTLLKKTLPEIPGKVTIAAAALGHLRESVLARGWQEARPPAGALAMVVGWSFYRQNQQGEKCTGLSVGESRPQ